MVDITHLPSLTHTESSGTPNSNNNNAARLSTGSLYEYGYDYEKNSSRSLASHSLRLGHIGDSFKDLNIFPSRDIVDALVENYITHLHEYFPVCDLDDLCDRPAILQPPKNQRSGEDSTLSAGILNLVLALSSQYLQLTEKDTNGTLVAHQIYAQRARPLFTEDWVLLSSPCPRRVTFLALFGLYALQNGTLER